MKEYNGYKFSTFDNDNDAYTANAAYSYGAFWNPSSSTQYNPNRFYDFVQDHSTGNHQPYVKVFTGKVKGTTKYITKISMMVRRK